MGSGLAAPMTAILVHGVPDTDHVWHRVVPHLGREDVVTVRLPGFGTPRSAIKVGDEWGPDVARITAPGLILWGAHDPYAPPTWGERLARRTRARLVTFPDCSHWWPLERPAEVATELRAFWRSVSS